MDKESFFLAIREIQDFLQKGETTKAKSLLDSIELMLKEIPSAKLKAPFSTLWSHYYFQIGEYEKAREVTTQVMRIIEESDPLFPSLLLQLSAVELHLGTADSTTEDRLKDTILKAEHAGDIGTAGDAAFNFGTIINIRGEDDLALEYYKKAMEYYSDEGRNLQVNDCLHLIGTILRIQNKDEEAISILLPALANAIKMQAHNTIVACGGDLARTYFCMWSDRDDRPDTLLNEAEKILLIAIASDEILWDIAGNTEKPTGARLHLAKNRFNNLETGLLVAKALGEELKASFHLVKNKGAVLCSKIQDTLCTRAESLRAREPDLFSPEKDFLWIETVPFAVREVSKKLPHPMAVVDQFALSGDQIFSFFQVQNSEDDWYSTIISSLVTDPSLEVVSQRGSFGKGQGVQGQEFLRKITSELERFTGFVPSIYDDQMNLPTDSLENVQEETQKINGMLQILGNWLFPKDLCEALHNSKVGHLIISPDPRFWGIPWNSLILGNGLSMLDQEWTWSILPSMGFIHLFECDPEAGDGVVVFAPDRDVYDRLGGKQEIDSMKALGIVHRVVIEEEATIDSLASLKPSEQWIHIRTHGAFSEKTQSHVPKMANGVWEEEIHLEKPATLFSASCRTGEGKSTAQDILGLVEIAIASGFKTIVAPVVSLDGLFASQFVASFYEGLSQGLNVAQAHKFAAKWAREKFIHPALWGTFLCVGDFFSKTRKAMALR